MVDYQKLTTLDKVVIGVSLAIFAVLLLAVSYGCASTAKLEAPLFAQTVVVEPAPVPVPIPDDEDWVVATDGASVCTAGILLGTGKAARCKWYKVEFEEFYARYALEAKARQQEHEAVEAFVKEVEAFVQTQDGWFVRNQLWIGLTAGFLVGGLGTAYVITR